MGKKKLASTIFFLFLAVMAYSTVLVKVKARVKQPFYTTLHFHTITGIFSIIVGGIQLLD